jgi:hypothetical protein
LVVGIPLEPNAAPLATPLFRHIQHSTKCSKHSICTHNPPFPLAYRCIQAYLLSAFDHHAFGCLFPRQSTDQLQPSLDARFRALLHAPGPLTHRPPFPTPSQPVAGAVHCCGVEQSCISYKTSRQPVTAVVDTLVLCHGA